MATRLLQRLLSFQTIVPLQSELVLSPQKVAVLLSLSRQSPKRSVGTPVSGAISIKFQQKVVATASPTVQKLNFDAQPAEL